MVFFSSTLKVLAQQGLGKYCDPDLVRVTQREMQEALDMTTEEMDLAAHELINQRGPRLNKSSDIDRYKQQ
jgi:hypothetical protein